MALEDLAAVKAEEQEQALIACCLVDASVGLEAAARLQPEDFYRIGHQHIFRAIKNLALKEEPHMPLAVVDELNRMKIEDVEYGGLGYLFDLAGDIPLTAHAPYLMQRVKETSRRRQLVDVAHRIKSLALDPAADDPVSSALGLLVGIENGRGAKTRKHIADFLRDQYTVIESAAEAKQRGEPLSMIESGFYDLDRALMMTPGKMLVLAARPAMGKSAMAFNIACNVAKQHPVLHVTLEMSGQELATRMFAGITGKDAYYQAHGLMLEEDWTKMSKAIDEYDALKMQIDEAAVLTVGEILASARQYQVECGEPLGLLVVDYLGLIDDDTTKDETQKIGRISRGLKLIAKSLKCPVLVLAQLNRGVEQRDNKRPQLSDLRQSGAIEQDADAVMFVYRDAYYNKDSPMKNVTELIIAKNRAGKTTKVYLEFQPESTRFLSSTYQPPKGEDD